MARIGVVAGIVSEVAALGRWAEDARVAVAVSGARPERAEAAARRMAADGAEALVSWGLAGGLAPNLAPGALIEPGALILPDGARMALEHGATDDVAILGSERIIVDPIDKARLRAETGAVAVDMESHRLARVARETGARLRVVRAISDPWNRTLPSLAVDAVGEDGRLRMGRILAGTMRRPWEIPRLLAAKGDSDRALAALRAIADEMMETLLAHGRPDSGGSSSADR